MKKTAIAMTLALTLALFCIPGVFRLTAAAGEIDGADKAKAEEQIGDAVEDQLGALDTEALEEYLATLDEETLALLGGSDVKTVLRDLVTGDLKLEYGNLFNLLIQFFFDGVISMLPVFVTVAAIAVFSGLTNSVKPRFLSDSNGNLIFFVCFSAILLLLLATAFRMVFLAKNAVTNMVRQMDALFPLLLTLMAASGGAVSVSVYKPAVAFLAAGISQAVLSVVLPLTSLIIVFSVVSNLSVSVRLNRFNDFFKSCNKWVMGLCVTIFTVFMSVQGITAAGFDGLSLRAAKYAIGNSVPIIGGFLRDGFDLVLAGSVLIKNAAGAWGVVLILATVLAPVLQLAGYSLFLKMTAAVTEPVSDARISGFLGSLSSSVGYLVASVLCVGFMFFLSLMLLICSSNVFF